MTVNTCCNQDVRSDDAENDCFYLFLSYSPFNCSQDKERS